MGLSLPSMALDTRFPAGMTTPGLFRKRDRVRYNLLKKETLSRLPFFMSSHVNETWK